MEQVGEHRRPLTTTTSSFNSRLNLLLGSQLLKEYKGGKEEVDGTCTRKERIKMLVLEAERTQPSLESWA